MRKLRLWAVRPKRNTSKRHPGHETYQYIAARQSTGPTRSLLAKAGVWAADITYIPMRRDFLPGREIMGDRAGAVLAAVRTRSRRGSASRYSSEALAGSASPSISILIKACPRESGSAESAGDEFAEILTDHGIAISMNKYGRCHDNIFVERWWTVKHQWVYLRPAANGIEQKRSLWRVL